MPFQVGAYSASSPRPPRRPPPNYFASATRWRLFLIVAIIVFVTGLIERWNDPRVQRFLGLAERPFAGGAPLAENEIADHEVDTRRAFPKSTDAPNVQISVADTTGRSESEGRESSTEKESQSAEATAAAPGIAAESHALEAAWRDAWVALLRECPQKDEDQLFARLRAARGRGDAYLANDDGTAAWKSRVAAWDVAWKNYVKEARAALDQQTPPDHPRWEKLLDEVLASWPTLWRPLLDTLGQEVPEAPELAQLVVILQQIADERALDQVRDDTIWRGSETNIWFRLVERIRALDEKALREASLGPTGYLQLYKQPEHYRGKLVTIRGTIRLAYRVDATDNVEGVKEYTLLWLHPAGGPTSPIVVYALETPEGFPSIKHRDHDRGTTTLREDVEVTGYFFKRWAYEGRDGIHVAPLLLANAPQWKPGAGGDADGPASSTIVLAVVASAAIGIGVAVTVMHMTRRENVSS